MKGNSGRLAEILEVSPARSAEAAADSEAIPLSHMDGRYANLRPDNKTISRLHIVDRQGNVRSFQYVHLDSDSQFGAGEQGQFFVLQFTWGTGEQKVRVTVHGRNLWRMYDYIMLHRWPYLREADRDFGGDGDEIVNGIKMETVVDTDNTSN